MKLFENSLQVQVLEASREVNELLMSNIPINHFEIKSTQQRAAIFFNTKKLCFLFKAKPFYFLNKIVFIAT